MGEALLGSFMKEWRVREGGPSEEERGLETGGHWASIFFSTKVPWSRHLAYPDPPISSLVRQAVHLLPDPLCF